MKVVIREFKYYYCECGKRISQAQGEIVGVCEDCR